MTAAPTTTALPTTAGPTAAPGETQGASCDDDADACDDGDNDGDGDHDDDDGDGDDHDHDHEADAAYNKNNNLPGCQCMPDFLIYWLQAKILLSPFIGQTNYHFKQSNHYQTISI